MTVEITAEHKRIAEMNGINYSTLYKRVKRDGWSIARAVTEEPKQRKRK